MQTRALDGIGRECVPELAGNIAGWVVLTYKELSDLHDTHRSANRLQQVGRHTLHKPPGRLCQQDIRRKRIQAPRYPSKQPG